MRFAHLKIYVICILFCFLWIPLGCKGRGIVKRDDAKEMPPGWRVASFPSSGSTMLNCANRSTLEWKVGSEGAKITVTPIDPKHSFSDPLPSQFKRSEKMQGTARVVHFSRGDLVGFDGGEYGGGLWFSDGNAKPGSALLTENVRGLFPAADGLWVLTATNDLEQNRGSLWLVKDASGKPVVEQLTAFSGSPRVAIKSDDKTLIIATAEGVMSYTQGGQTRSLVSLPLEGLYPNSLALDSKGGIFIGMRLYVIHLEPDVGVYNSSWLLPPECSLESESQGGCQCP